VWKLISVYVLRISNHFINLDNLVPASGRPAPELEVKAQKIAKVDFLEQVLGSPN
jgi:hypothetical protein